MKKEELYILYILIYHQFMLETQSGPKASQPMYSAYEVQGKLYLEINDANTYKGVLENSPYYDLKEIKDIFLSGEMQVSAKTSTKMCIKFGFLKVDLQSQTSYQLQQMKKQIQELQNKLKLVQKSKGWEEQDLNSTAPFDVDYIYKINTTSGWSLTSTGVSAATIHFNYAGTNYSTQSGNRKANSTGWTVTKIMKLKV